MTWAFIVWILLAIARAVTAGAANLGRGRTAAGATQIAIGALFAWGIFLPFERRPAARTFWLITIGTGCALFGLAAALTTGEQRELCIATALWLAVWALYLARSKRLRAALAENAEVIASAV